VQVKKMGKSVIIVSPDKHIGGLSSGGLGFTDSGNIRTSAAWRGTIITGSTSTMLLKQTIRRQFRVE
jgi:hypothetical protein